MGVLLEPPVLLDEPKVVRLVVLAMSLLDGSTVELQGGVVNLGDGGVPDAIQRAAFIASGCHLDSERHECISLRAAPRLVDGDLWIFRRVSSRLDGTGRLAVGVRT